MEKKPLPPGWTQQDMDRALRNAASRGEVDRVLEALSYGASPNVPFNEGKTALHEACSEDHPKVVRLLLEHGADPNLDNVNGQTPFALACGFHAAACIRVLLESGKLDFDQKDARGRKYLVWAAEHGLIDAVEHLIAKGVDLDEPEPGGDSALMKALRNDRKTCARRLVEAGANVNFVNAFSKETPLLVATKYGSGEMMEMLIKSGADVHAKTTGAMNALHLACQNQAAGKALILLRAGVDPDLICVDMGQQKTAFELYAANSSSIQRDYIGSIFLAYGAKNTAAMPEKIKSYSTLKAAVAAGLTDRCVQLIEEGHSVEPSKPRQKNLIAFARSRGFDNTALAMEAAVSRKKIQDLLGRNASKGPSPS